MITAKQKLLILWNLQFAWDKGTFSPEEEATIYLYVENVSGRPLFINRVRICPDWSSNFFLCLPQKDISQWTQPSILRLTIKIPSNITGTRTIDFALETFVYHNEIGKWHNYGFIKPEGIIPLYIKPEPVYRVFISRSNWEQDKPLINPIVKRISEWGFSCYTVGINVKAKDPNKPTPEIKREIARADCLIAIATPRDLLVKYGMWTAPDWLHGEVGIGFGKEKPILVIYEENIRLSGLPAQFYHIPFSMYTLSQLMPKIDAIMPYIRKWIKKRNWDILWTNIFKSVTFGAIGYGIYKAGEQEGRRKRKG